LICLGGILKYANATLFFPAKPTSGGDEGASLGGRSAPCQSDDWPGAKQLSLGILSQFRQIGRYDKEIFV
jgi:hypothetical protein